MPCYMARQVVPKTSHIVIVIDVRTILEFLYFSASECVVEMEVPNALKRGEKCVWD